MKILNWSEVPFNPWWQKPHPAMLKEGILVEKEITKDNIGFVQVKYDRAFVVQYLARMIIKPLMIASPHEWQKLTGEAWRAYKENEKQGDGKTILVLSTDGEANTDEAIG